jgi:hypothetical protein
MRLPTLLVSSLILLAACRNDPPQRRNRSNRNGNVTAPNNGGGVPAPPAPDAAPGTVGATGTGTGGGSAASAPQAPPEDVPPANGEEGVRVFRVADSACIRDPARNALGIGVHGFFGGGRLELEVRNVRYSCTPVPTYTAVFEDDVLHLRVVQADRAALTRCACRHDQFLQVTGVPAGAYTIQVEEVAAGDAGTITQLATGRIEATPDSPAAPAAAAPAEGAPAAAAGQTQ